MLTLKVKLGSAQKWKEYLVKNGLFDRDHILTKDEHHIYYPITKKFEMIKADAEFIDVPLKKRKISGDMKTELENDLSAEEMKFLRKAHDVIGDIAILEIPRQLVRKEKIIAQKFLKLNTNVKTVLKKYGSHSGSFRVQKMKYLAGKNNKEALYKENNVFMRLDVEKVYFSVRLGNERKRISELIRPGEEILVMFSGCAPYPLVFSKNTKAANITGIEINPAGHMYGQDNIFLNKAHNVLLVNDDVKKAAPNIMKRIVGLKSSMKTKELNARLRDKPQILELVLFDHDLFKNYKKIESTIKKLKSKGMTVFMHMPYHVYNPKNDYEKNPRPQNRQHYNLSQQDIGKEIEMLTLLGELCKKHKTHAIVHVNDHAKPTDKSLLIENMKLFEKYYDHFYFETMTSGFGPIENILEIGAAAAIKNVCIDLSHLFIMYQDNDKIIEAVKKIKSRFNTYFHIADNNKVTHTCEIGKGFLDFERIAPLVNQGIIEIQCKDYEASSNEMTRSWKTFNNLSALKKYDRIVMPLPKTADHYLDEALTLSKKGTIIHFYDFLEEDKFEEAKKKIADACKRYDVRYRIIDIFKCGQQSPYVYRICVDFEIL